VTRSWSKPSLAPELTLKVQASFPKIAKDIAEQIESTDDVLSMAG